MTPYTYLYLDYYQGDAKTEPPAFPALLPLEKVYSYEPYSSLLTTAEHAYIKGVQGNLWSENIRDGKHADYMVFPRGLALAEIAWSPAAAKNYTRFLEKLKTRLAVMDQNQINFRIPEPVGLANQIGLESSASVRLATGVANSTIFYTLDGSQPSVKSDKYTQPFTLQLKDNQPILLKTIVVLASGRQSGVYTATLEKKPLKDASSVRPTALGISYRTTTEKVLLAKELRIAASEASKSMSKIGVAALPQAPFIGAIYEGYIFADSDGMYSFKVRSDDGAVLYIDEELVVDNDGPHPPREVTGSVALQRGYHKIKLHYFDSGEGRVLEVSARKGKDNYDLDQKLFIMGE
jgi:hexosaminidase